MRIAVSSLTRARRSRTVLAVAAAGALVLSGCSESGLSSSVAAVVDGEEITVAQVQQATEEFNTLPVSPITPADVLTVLVYGDLAEEAYRAAGNPPVTDAQLISDLRGGGLQNPSESVLDLYRSINYLQGAQSRLPVEELEIEINPRYGTWDGTNGQVVAQTPDWITEVTGQSVDEAQN